MQFIARRLEGAVLKPQHRDRSIRLLRRLMPQMNHVCSASSAVRCSLECKKPRRYGRTIRAKGYTSAFGAANGNTTFALWGRSAMAGLQAGGRRFLNYQRALWRPRHAPPHILLFCYQRSHCYSSECPLSAKSGHQWIEPTPTAERKLGVI